MKTLTAIALLTTALLLPGHNQAAPGLPSSNVAWVAAAGDADVDRAFARARAERKPLLLYWGASWCPPCNQLKATLFNRQDFAVLSRSFVAVHVDGDRPGAQLLSRRFKVTAYPTVVVFNDQGLEITRLPGQVDAPQMMAVLQLGLAGGRPVKAVMADALAGKALQPAEWRLLSFYSWETDEQQLVPKAELAQTLLRLALASTGPSGGPHSKPANGDAEHSTRLWLKAVAASTEAPGIKVDVPLRERVARVLADPTQSRLHMDVLTASADDIVRTLQPEAGKDRATLVHRFDQTLQRLQADGTLSRGDRLGALWARVELARLDQAKDLLVPQLPPPLVAEVRDHVARLDRETSDAHERQAVVSSAAYTLGRAGLWADSEALLKAQLAKKSPSPYYLMSQLGSDARKQGRKADALAWYRQAFEASEGPATRLQWGVGYLNALVDLAPQDTAGIEKTTRRLLTEAGQDSGAFAGRSGRDLKRASQKLLKWADQPPRAAALARLRGQAQALCSTVDTAADQRAVCEALFKPAAAAPAA